MAPSMIDEAEVGKRIRQFRLEKKITLGELAARTSFTKGYLSKIENTKKAPPVSTLLILAKSLNISVSDILGEKNGQNPICLVKKDERRSIARDGTIFGYAYETLAHKFYNKRMEPYILTLPPNVKENALFQHKGEEMMYVLQGKMKFYYGDQTFLVEVGDCVYFDGHVPHYGTCVGKKEVKCLMVITAPE